MMRKLLPSWFHLGWKPSRAPTSIIVTFLSLRSPEKSGVSLMPAIFASHNEMVLPVLLIKPLLGASSAFVGMLTRFDLILIESIHSESAAGIPRAILPGQRGCDRLAAARPRQSAQNPDRPCTPSKGRSPDG